MKLIVLQAAQAELEDAHAYYLGNGTPRTAAAFVADYQHSAARLLELPGIGTPISAQLRSLPMRHFPYSIIYRVTADAIVIHAVAHHSRRPMYWAGRR